MKKRTIVSQETTSSRVRIKYFTRDRDFLFGNFQFISSRLIVHLPFFTLSTFGYIKEFLKGKDMKEQ